MKKRVLITGVTGTMGSAGLRHLLEHKDKLELVTLVRPSEKNKKQMAAYEEDSIEVIWGDLTNYEDVRRAVEDTDYILHIAAMVSPMADSHPEKAWEVNVGSTENILRAIDELGLEEVKLVYIGTVAETGSRLPPIHWGRVGDPIKASVFDHYAVSKIAAERLVIESGLKHWVSLRQTGILYYDLLDMMDPIMYHQPWNNVLEWVTEEDSGRLLANLCIKDLPDSFWKRAYNIGGGESCRVNNYEFTAKTLGALGVQDIEKVFDLNWYATQNFHGQYYLDSDELNDYLDFQRESFDDFIQRLKDQLKFPTKMMKYIPNYFIKNFIMKPVAKAEGGSLNWIEKNDEVRIKAFFGSMEEYDQIGDWKDFAIEDDYDEVKILDHGYDEEKDKSLFDIEDMKEAANFRGGECLSDAMERGDLDSMLKWRCAFSHEFEASPRLVLQTGHWCEECEAPPWRHEEIAKKNPFFAQVF